MEGSGARVHVDGVGILHDSAHAGRATLSPGAAQALVQSAVQPPTPGHDLTERERDVLALLVEGLNNTQIAGRLVVSPSTLKSHVSHILNKLGVASRTEAAALGAPRACHLGTRLYCPSKIPPLGGYKTPPADGCGRGSFVV